MISSAGEAMASKSPWSVKGISPEDREQAKIAARRAGVPVGAWLSERIREAGANGGSPKSAEPETSDKDASATASETEEYRPRLPGRRGAIDNRFSFGPGQWSVATDAVEAGRIGQPPPQPWPAARPPVMPHPPAQLQPPPQPQPHPHQHMPAMATHWTMPPLTNPMYPQHPPATQQPPGESEEVKALERKIESLQKRLAAAEARSARELEAMSQKLDMIDGLAREMDELRSAGPQQPDAQYSTAPVERAVMRLSERLQRVEDLVLPDESGGGFLSRLFRRR